MSLLPGKSRFLRPLEEGDITQHDTSKGGHFPAYYKTEGEIAAYYTTERGDI